MKTSFLLSSLACAGLVLGASAASNPAAPVYNGPAKAQEVRARLGAGNFLAKLRAGKSVTVAYLGGSITAQNGWRVKTSKYFRESFPKAKVREIDAAIGGTGSGLGVYRVGHDALAYKPDLLFVEFATNDGGVQPAAIWRQMEGIVRQAWHQDPRMDVVFTYTITVAMTNDYLHGNCNRAASAMEQLADHYGIPSINFGPRVAKLLAENKLIIDPKALVETAVPVESAARDKKIRDAHKDDPRILFANDGVHPRDEGHELYLQSIKKGFEAMADLPAVDHAAKMATPFVADNLEAAKMVPITKDMLSGNWKLLDAKNDTRHVARFASRMGEVWEADTPGAKLSFRFRGRACQIYDLLGPDGGKIQVKLDGKVVYKSDRFDSYCTYYRLATLGVPVGAKDAEHAVELEILPEQPNRRSVAFRLKDPDKELAGKKYDGTGFWPGAIQIVGDLL